MIRKITFLSLLVLITLPFQTSIFSQNNSPESVSSASLSDSSSLSPSSSSSSLSDSSEISSSNSSLDSQISVDNSSVASSSSSSITTLDASQDWRRNLVVKLKAPKTDSEFQRSLTNKAKADLIPLDNSSEGQKSDLKLVGIDEQANLKVTIDELKKNKDVESVTPNYPYKTFSTNPSQNPSYTGNQYYLKNSAVNPYGIYANAAWQAIAATLPSGSNPNLASGGDPDVKIAVIDTGVNTALADFAGLSVVNPGRIFHKTTTCNPLANEEFLAGPFLDGGVNKYLCIQSGTQSDVSSNGHGTAVASTIFMQDNTIGGVGVAHNTSLMPISLQGLGFSTYGVAKGIEYAVANGAKVINLSLGTPFDDTPVKQEIEEAVAQNVVVVASSGNCGDKTTQQCFGFLQPGDPGFSTVNPIVYPAAYDQVISVGAINPNGTRAAYSTYNAFVDVVAPVGSAASSGNSVIGYNNSGVLQYWTGTSFSAPQVAGAVGLLLSVNPDGHWRPELLNSIFNRTSSDLGSPGRDIHFGSGNLNIISSISILANSNLFNGTLTDNINDVFWRNTVTGANENIILGEFGNISSRRVLPTVSEVAGWRVVGTGDFNGDGRSDILWRNTNGTTVTWSMNANGDYVSGRVLPTVSEVAGWRVVGTGDFNGDGRSDILWRNTNGTTVTWSMNANGDYVSGRVLPTVSEVAGWRVVGTGDFNGDGRSDILWRNTNGTTVTWSMNANGDYVSGRVLPTVSEVAGWRVVGTGDFNGDGRSDILWRNTNGTTVTWSMNANGDYVSGRVLPTVSEVAGWRVVGTGDFNGDGRSDILWRNTDGTTVTWSMNANGDAFLIETTGTYNRSSGWTVGGIL